MLTPKAASSKVKAVGGFAGSLAKGAAGGLDAATGGIAGKTAHGLKDGVKGAAGGLDSMTGGVASGLAGGLKDSLYEMKDSVVARAKPPPALIDALTPEDRWFEPASGGWPKAVAELPASLHPDKAEPYKLSAWKPPPTLTAAEAPHLVPAAGDDTIGEVRVEVLQCEALPKLMVGIVDPYVVIVVEKYAGRTGAERNERNPCFGVDTPRAFKFPVACPYSLINVAVNDEDDAPLSGDDPLGRTAIDLSQLHGRTVYDAWFHLQYGMHTRLRGKRGSIRLRFSVEWRADRVRLLSYPRALPTFAVPFISKKALRNSVFAVQGRFANPSKYDARVFHANLGDLKRFVNGVVKTVLNFFFYRYPALSACIFLLWQLIVSYPTEALFSFPFVALLGLSVNYLRLPPRPPLELSLSILDMLMILLLNQSVDGVTVDAGQQAPEAQGKSDGDESDDAKDGEDDNDEEEEKDKGSGEGGGEGEDGGGEGGDAKAADGASGGGEAGGAGKKGKGGFLGKMTAVGSAVGSAALNPVKQIKSTVGGVASKAGDLTGGLGSMLKPSKPSLAEEIERVRYEAEEEIFSQAPPERDQGAGGFTLNPIAKVLGPIQGLIHNGLVYVRIAQRVAAWEDRILTFQLCLVLLAVCLVLGFLGEVLMLVPWGLVFQWLFRLVGIALFGPHMYWVGKQYRLTMREEEAKAKAFDEASSREREAILEEKRQEFLADARARYEKATSEKQEPEPDEGTVLEAPPPGPAADGKQPAKKAYHLLVRPRPTAGKLRFRFTPDLMRTRAYPLHPSEDRPPLTEDAGATSPYSNPFAVMPQPVRLPAPAPADEYGLVV